MTAPLLLEEPRIPVVQLTTVFYQLQNSEMITEKLSDDIKRTMNIEQKTEEINVNFPIESVTSTAGKNLFSLYEA